MDKNLGLYILKLKKRIAPKFTEGDWTEVGLLTGLSGSIYAYPRLYRSRV